MNPHTKTQGLNGFSQTGASEIVSRLQELPVHVGPLLSPQTSPKLSISSITSPPLAMAQTQPTAVVPPLTDINDAPTSIVESNSSANTLETHKSQRRRKVKQKMVDIGVRSGVSDFYIVFKDRDKNFYEPGDVVSGIVILVLSKKIKTMYTLLKLEGRLEYNNVREKVAFTFFEDEILLWGTESPPSQETDTLKSCSETFNKSSKASYMDAGEHCFEFEFILPQKSLPSSVEVRILFILIFYFIFYFYFFFFLEKSYTLHINELFANTHTPQNKSLARAQYLILSLLYISVSLPF